MKRQIRILGLALLVLLSTGCTKYLKDDNKSVVYEATGQTLASNILCKPVGEDLYNFYKDHESSMQVKLDELPDCNEFQPNSLKYVSIWESVFIKPIAWLILNLGKLVGNFGISVMIMSLIIRALMLPLSKSSMTQSESMKKAQPELEKIEKKYRNKDDKDSMMMKSQEMMMVYKKYNINPVTSCLTALIQLPLFFAFLEAINRVPAIFEGTIFASFFQMNLGMTPVVGIQHGMYIYIALIAIIILTTYFNFRITMKQQPQQEGMNQMNQMMIFMLIMISIASLNLPTAIALYWVVNNIFAIVQSVIIKKSSERRK